MKRTIEDLWYGNILPEETCGLRDPEMEKLSILIERNRESLAKLLAGPQKEAFEKYIDCVEEYGSALAMYAFQDGFCLASKLLTEALSNQP